MPENVEALTDTVPEFARDMKLAVSTVYAAIQRGEIPCVRIGRAVRVPRRFKEKLLDEAEGK